MVRNKGTEAEIKHEEVITWEAISENHPMYEKSVELEGMEGRYIQVKTVTLGRAKGYGAAVAKYSKPVTDEIGDAVLDDAGFPMTDVSPGQECPIWDPTSMALDEGWEIVSSRGAKVKAGVKEAVKG